LKFAAGVNIQVLRLDPGFMRLINIVDTWGKAVPKMKTKNVKAADLHPLLLQYLDHLNAQYPRSYKFDKTMITAFLRWLCQTFPDVFGSRPEQIDVKLIREHHILQYKAWLEDRLKSRIIKLNTVSQRLQKVKNWCSFLVGSGILYSNPVNIKLKWRFTRRNPILLEDDEVEAFIIAVFENSPYPLDELALFALYITTGLRSTSVLGTKVKDFSAENRTLTVVLKGRKEHTQALPSAAVFWMERYLSSRVTSNEDEPLWLNSLNGTLSYDSVLRRFCRYAKLAVITQQIGGAHYFRHFFFSEMVGKFEEFLEEIVIATGAKSQSEITPYIHSRDRELLGLLIEKYPRYKRVMCHENEPVQ
jgi:site-specific recombinase XerD